MSRDVKLLHPELQIIHDQWLAECRRQGLNVLVTQTWRTKAEQDALYAQGRTTKGNIVTNCKYPNSPHCWGVAFDFCRNVKGKEYDDSDDFFRKVGEIGKKLGLTWGGDFKSFVDKPHLEMKKYMPNASVNTLLNKYGTPEAFKATWKDESHPAYLLAKAGKINSPDYWVRVCRGLATPSASNVEALLEKWAADLR
jgi:peptidoglycan L-alanyl-D-glutamate endopeptidase CwlK